MAKHRSALLAYRSLMRVLEKHVTCCTRNGMWKEYARDEFRKNASLKDQDKAKRLVVLSEEYADLVKDIHARKELLFSYNIGVERDQKTIVEKTARRVGLELPKG